MTVVEATGRGDWPPPSLLRSAAGGALRDLGGVSCATDDDTDQLAALLADSSVTRLTLVLRGDNENGTEISGEAVGRLVASAGFQKLARLWIASNCSALGETLTKMLADPARTPNLAQLYVHNRDSGAALAPFIAALRARFGPECGWF